MSLLSETAARELWCPMVRIVRDEGSIVRGTLVGGCNTDALGGTRVPASCRCIASKCAMWRWASTDSDFTRMGYCGLAGPAVHS